MKTALRFRGVIRSGITLLVLCLAIGLGCSRRHEPLSVDTQAPPVPVNLRLTADSTSISLSWSVDDASRVTGFRIYRAEGGGDFRFLATTTAPQYADHNVTIGVDYSYRITAVVGAVEGLSSVTVFGGPAAFGLVLNGGARVTNGGEISPGTRTIRVDLIAPAGTETYRLSEDSTFTGSPLFRFDPAAPNTTIQLSAGDGLKAVFAQFQRGAAVLSPLVRATITLDTHAEIHSVTENSGGQVLGVGNTLHFTVTADSGGNASISLGSVITGLRLPDDGTAGDPVASDGSYERDFVIPAGMEVVSAVVQAQFTDAAGNQAFSIYSSTDVTIADPPRPISFIPSLIRVVGATVGLAWTHSLDSDFAQYVLYRSAAGVDTVTTQDQQVTVITDRDQTNFVDSNVDEGTLYRWGIAAVDSNGFASPLRSIAATTGRLPVISATSVDPATGSTTLPFTFECRYSHPANVAPHEVRLVVDGTSSYIMGQLGTGNDWVGGERFQSIIDLARGAHVYRFETTDSLGAASRAPESGDFGGPLVTD